jgi:hypothetical protein
MSHVLYYPSVGTPTYTITLHPALVRINDHGNAEPAQRLLEAQDFTQYVFQVSGNVRKLFQVEITDLHEADWGSFSGLTSLYTFFATRTIFGLNPFDFTHDDGITFTVRLIAPFWQFMETQKARHTGSLTFLGYYIG